MDVVDNPNVALTSRLNHSSKMDGITGGVMNVIDWIAHPAKHILVQADQAVASKSFVNRQVSSRLLLITSIGAAAVEAVGCAIKALVLMSAGWCRTTLCLVLRGTSLLTWAVIGYLSSVTLEKSTFRWIQFIAFQALLGYGNPKSWWAQCKLWARMLHAMGTFALDAAAMADNIEHLVNRFASWEQVSGQVSRSVSLGLYGLFASVSVWNPTNAIDKYNLLVEELPDRRPLHQRMIKHLQQHKGLVATAGLVGLGLLAHVSAPGYDTRTLAAHEGAKQLWSAATVVTQAAAVVNEVVLDFTARPIYRYWTNRPDYNAFNQLIHQLLQERIAKPSQGAIFP